MTYTGLNPVIERLLHEGTVIPAHPLALKHDLKINEDRQRALTRYYLACGAGGVAVGRAAESVAVSAGPRCLRVDPAAGCVWHRIGLHRIHSQDHPGSRKTLAAQG